jgi:hypothetical protein
MKTIKSNSPELIFAGVLILSAIPAMIIKSEVATWLWFCVFIIDLVIYNFMKTYQDSSKCEVIFDESKRIHHPIKYGELAFTTGEKCEWCGSENQTQKTCLKCGGIVKGDK